MGKRERAELKTAVGFGKLVAAIGAWWCFEQNLWDLEKLSRHRTACSVKIDPRAPTGKIEILRPGIEKMPARLMALLSSGSTYICCFDGSVKWDTGEAGAASCLHKEHRAAASCRASWKRGGTSH